MIFFADFHIHSRFSRATSKDCSLPELAKWACLKGLRVVATGDATHPEWRREIHEMLSPSGNGLFHLRDEYCSEGPCLPDGFSPGDVQFVLNAEISSIYKRDGAVRKVHNLVFLPNLEAMDLFSSRLERIGNIRSDGRPILGLDCRDLLEIALETSIDSFMIPAHIWTPWFSILGSKSGFDSVEECFRDLSAHIFALETGLSSDPAMNSRVSSLDKYTLVSNSDTHSPARVGREANVFTGQPSYTSIRDAMRTGGGWIRQRLEADTISPQSVHDLYHHTTETKFAGTIEFFPEEGKYHLDGHRKCACRLEPSESEKLGNRCPACGQPVTIGVMNRVMRLADRPSGNLHENAAPFWRTLPLSEIVCQTLGLGPQSKKVQEVYLEILNLLGPELSILWVLPLDHIGSVLPEILVEAIRRTRSEELTIKPGFDGEYGKVELFGPGERERMAGQGILLGFGHARRMRMPL